jgi:molybdenum-dependent DNA-binding transcriptional regulator ModE
MFQAMRQQNRPQRLGGECVLSVTTGGFAGGGAEKTPAGDYSINTRRLLQNQTGARQSINTYAAPPQMVPLAMSYP